MADGQFTYAVSYPNIPGTPPQPFRDFAADGGSPVRSSLELSPAKFRAAIWRGGSTVGMPLHVHGRTHLGSRSVSRPLDRIEVAATVLRADPPDVAYLHKAPECPVCVGAKHPADLLPGDAGALTDQLIDLMCNGGHARSPSFTAAPRVGGIRPLDRKKEDPARGPLRPSSVQ